MKKLRPNLVMLAEPFASELRLEALKNSLKFDDCFSNQCSGGKLWLLWGEGLQESVMNESDQHITISIVYDSKLLFVSVVYAKCNHMDRQALWRLLQKDMPQDDPWLYLGDFNIIREDAERCGGRPWLMMAMD